MVKRSREEASSLLAQQQHKQENTTRPPPSKRCRELSVGGAATGMPGEAMEKSTITGDSLSSQGVAGATEARDVLDVGAAAVGLPRWWRLWLGRGGGAVVNYEELLCGWFPFVDEDFSCDVVETMGRFSVWGDEGAWQQEDDLYNDIWQLKHVSEIPGNSR